MCLSGIALLIQVLAISGTVSLQSDVSATNQSDNRVIRQAIHPGSEEQYWQKYVFPIASEVNSLKEEINSMKDTIDSQERSIESVKYRPVFRCESGMVEEYTRRKWPYRVHVTFKHPFQGAPSLMHGLAMVDAPPSTTLRVRADVDNVTNKGFQAVLQTWAGSILYGTRMTWMACGF